MENIDANLLLFYITFLAVLSVFLPAVLCVVMDIWHVSFFHSSYSVVLEKKKTTTTQENNHQQMVCIMYGMLFLEENHTVLQGAALPTAQQYCPACSAHCCSLTECFVPLNVTMFCVTHTYDPGHSSAAAFGPFWETKVWLQPCRCIQAVRSTDWGSFPWKLLATELGDQPRVSHTLLPSA